MIYVLTLKHYDYHEFTEVVSASTSLVVLMDYVTAEYPNLKVYTEDSPIYRKEHGNLQFNETEHLTIMVFTD